MDSTEQEYYLQWIIADYTPFMYNDRPYFISTPSRETKFVAERMYVSVYSECLKNGLLDEQALNTLLNKYGFWDSERETLLQKLTKDIEEIKVFIFDNYTNTSKRRDYKKALKDTFNYIEKLSIEKQVFDTYSAKAVALFAKQHYLLGCSIFKRKNIPLWKNWWDRRDDDIIQHCYKVLSEYYLTDKDYREISRCGSWRSMWSSRKSVGNLFGRAVVDLSIQQKQLLVWSNVYDSVYKNIECPSDEIVEDDDALDGWMIKQRRKRNKELNKTSIEDRIGNDRIRNSEQVYIMCDPSMGDTITDNPSQVYECNDFEGKLRWQRITKQIEQEGCVPLMGLKDTHAEIRRKAAKIGAYQ